MSRCMLLDNASKQPKFWARFAVEGVGRLRSATDGGEAAKTRIPSNHDKAIDRAKSAVHATCQLAPGSDVTFQTSQLYITCHGRNSTFWTTHLYICILNLHL